MVSLCVGGRESDEWEWSDEDKAAEDAQKFLDVSSGPFCFTSTEARWLIRDGDGGKGTKE